MHNKVLGATNEKQGLGMMGQRLIKSAPVGGTKQGTLASADCHLIVAKELVDATQ